MVADFMICFLDLGFACRFRDAQNFCMQSAHALGPEGLHDIP